MEPRGLSVPSISDLTELACHPLVFDVAKSHPKPSVRRHIVDVIIRGPEDEFNESFDGIFASLTRECGQNPHTAQVVEITSPTTSWNEPSNVIDRNFESYWYTKDMKGSYIQFDLRDYRVNISAYSLKTNFGPMGAWHLKSWILIGSVDGSKWVCLDEQRDTPVLNGRNKWCKFTIVPIGWFRYIKLEMTDVNHWGDHSLVMSEFELFGEIECQDVVAQME